MGSAISTNARIAAVADHYDAMICARAGAEAAAPVHAAVRTIEQAGGSQFDPAIVRHFSDLVLPYPVGHPVVLPDGRPGVIARVDPGDRMRPTVRALSSTDGIIELVADFSPEAAAKRLAA
jgi:HD-GYP domain-containing protein (c-di-GMP phosphodiesterase class II)